MAERPLKVAVVGCGPWGRIHAEAYWWNTDTDLVAVCGRTEQKTRLMAERFRTKYYLSIEEMLDREQLDLVSISTGDADHFVPASAVLERGISVLLEKPITMNIEEARGLLSIARSRKVRFGINFNMRYLQPFQLARQMLDGGKVGKPVSLSWKFAHFWPPSARTIPLAMMIFMQGHGLNILRAFGGPIAELSCVAANPRGGDLFTTAAATVSFENGAVGVLLGGVDGNNSGDIYHFEMQGTGGRLTVNDAFKHFEYSPREGGLEQTWTPFLFDAERNSYQKTTDWHIAEVIRAQRDGRPEPIPAEEGYEALRASLAAVTSWREHRPVRLDEIAPAAAPHPNLYKAPLEFKEPRPALEPGAAYAEGR
jgi:predicted dehydrogenase